MKKQLKYNYIQTRKTFIVVVFVDKWGKVILIKNFVSIEIIKICS